MTKLFGTDGIRGEANTPPMNAEVALKVAMAAATVLRRGDHRHAVLIGKDTRLSGYLLEPALTAGFIGMGMDVWLVGPLPTPAIAMLTRSMRADLGVMISASHNPYHDNGLKFFGPDGCKLSDALEAAIEARVVQPFTELPTGEGLGRATRLEDAAGRYIENVKQTFPRALRLDGLKLVVDCAHGAAYKVAPRVLYELGAEVIALNAAPNGRNINAQCGATHPEGLQERVRFEQAHLGIALDGDADRLILVDETGTVIDGDQVMGLIARTMQAAGTLKGGLVATVMSNLGLERFMAQQNIPFARTAVGDRHVLAHQRKTGWNVGGEQSGHIILTDHSTTGDGLVAALQVLAALVESGRKASELCRVFAPVPQLLRNVRYAMGQTPLETAPVQRAIAAAEASLAGQGRLLVRKSGTEPLIRVMAEGDDAAVVEAAVAQVIAAVGEAA